MDQDEGHFFFRFLQLISASAASYFAILVGVLSFSPMGSYQLRRGRSVLRQEPELLPTASPMLPLLCCLCYVASAMLPLLCCISYVAHCTLLLTFLLCCLSGRAVCEKPISCISDLILNQVKYPDNLV